MLIYIINILSFVKSRVPFAILSLLSVPRPALAAPPAALHHRPRPLPPTRRRQRPRAD